MLRIPNLTYTTYLTGRLFNVISVSKNLWNAMLAGFWSVFSRDLSGVKICFTDQFFYLCFAKWKVSARNKGMFRRFLRANADRI